MPIGSTCRTCGATLPPDLGWCVRCLAPVTAFAARPRVHEPGSFVGTPVATPRTSRWRSGPTSFGPFGRIAITVTLLLFLPWWGLEGITAASAFHLWFLIGWAMLAALVLPQVWRRQRLPDDAPPSRIERFRQGHPVLGRPVRLGFVARGVVVLVAGGAALTAWLGLDDVNRYLWAVLALALGLVVSLASWNEL
jgi:hypothetical protein